MKRKSRFHTSFIAVAVILMTISCTAPEIQDIPITTSSEEARDLFIQGREYWEKIQLQKSSEFMQQAIDLDSTFAIAYFYEALNQTETQQVIMYLNKAAALADRASEGERLIILTVKTDFNNEFAKAAEYSQKLTAAYPRAKSAHFFTGMHHTFTQEFESAAKACEKAIEIDSGYAPAYNHLGYCYMYLEEYDRAEKAFKTYTDLLPDAANPYDSFGEILMKQGKFDESIKAYRKTLSIDPEFYSSYIGIGTNLIFKGEFEAARKEFQKLYDRAPDDGTRRRALLAKANSYLHQGEYAKALKALEQRYTLAEKTNDHMDMSGDVYLMADIYLDIGLLEKAKAHFIKSAELIEQSEIASPQQKNDTKQILLANRAYVALQRDDLKTAVSLSQAFRKQAETDNNPREIKTAHQLAGLIALHQRKYDTAIEELLQANQRDPRVLYKLAQAFTGSGKADKAREYCKRAANLNSFSTRYALVRNKAIKMLAAL